MDLSDLMDSQGMSIFLLVVTVVIMGFLIANVVYYSRLEKGETVTVNEAKNMLWINVILFILMLLIVAYYGWKTFVHKTVRDSFYDTVNEKTGKYVESASNLVSGLKDGIGSVFIPSTVKVALPGGVPQTATRRATDGKYVTSEGALWNCDARACNPAT